MGAGYDVPLLLASAWPAAVSSASETSAGAPAGGGGGLAPAAPSEPSARARSGRAGEIGRELRPIWFVQTRSPPRLAAWEAGTVPSDHGTVKAVPARARGGRLRCKTG